MLSLIVALAAALYFHHWLWGVVIGAVAYLLHCAARPSARCLWCHGQPRSYSASGRTWGTKLMCRWFCGGTGFRRRFGAVMMSGLRSDRDRS